MLHIPNNVSKLEGSTSLVMAAIFELPGSFAVTASLKQLQADVVAALCETQFVVRVWDTCVLK